MIEQTFLGNPIHLLHEGLYVLHTHRPMAKDEAVHLARSWERFSEGRSRLLVLPHGTTLTAASPALEDAGTPLYDDLVLEMFGDVNLTDLTPAQMWLVGSVIQSDTQTDGRTETQCQDR